MGDDYDLLATRNWRKGSGMDYSLQELDKDWINLTLPYLKGRTEHDGGRMIQTRVDGPPGTRVDQRGLPFPRGTPQTVGYDVIDARGTFNRQEVRKELKKLSNDELENRLGISFLKIDDILHRVKPEKDGSISYKKFLVAVQDYRLNSEQETRLKRVIRIFAFTEEFSCRPPTLFMIFISLLELGFFIYTSVKMPEDYGLTVNWSGPVPYCSVLIYNPARRFEAWRYFTYMFVHIGIQHFVFNMIMQIVVGISLEMSQPGFLGSVRVMIVYFSGVIAASLGTSLSDPDNYIAGASGGVYSLIAAHLATMALNWQEDSSVRIQKVVHKPITRIIRIVFLSLLTIHDIGFAIYVRFYDPANRTGFTGHLCGAIAGVLIGVFVLENRRVRSWEIVVQIICLVLFIFMLLFAIVWNIWGEQWSPGFFPRPDRDLYESFGRCKNYEIF